MSINAFRKVLGVGQKQEVKPATVSSLGPRSVVVTLASGRGVRCPYDGTLSLSVGDTVLVSVRPGGQGEVIKRVSEAPPDTLSHFVIS